MNNLKFPCYFCHSQDTSLQRKKKDALKDGDVRIVLCHDCGKIGKLGIEHIGGYVSSVRKAHRKIVNNSRRSPKTIQKASYLKFACSFCQSHNTNVHRHLTDYLTCGTVRIIFCNQCGHTTKVAASHKGSIEHEIRTKRTLENLKHVPK